MKFREKLGEKTFKKNYINSDRYDIHYISNIQETSRFTYGLMQLKGIKISCADL